MLDFFSEAVCEHMCTHTDGATADTLNAALRAGVFQPTEGGFSKNCFTMNDHDLTTALEDAFESMWELLGMYELWGRRGGDKFFF